MSFFKFVFAVMSDKDLCSKINTFLCIFDHDGVSFVICPFIVELTIFPLVHYWVLNICVRSVCLYVCLSIRMSVFLFVCLSVCTSVNFEFIETLTHLKTPYQISASKVI